MNETSISQAINEPSMNHGWTVHETIINHQCNIGEPSMNQPCTVNEASIHHRFNIASPSINDPLTMHEASIIKNQCTNNSPSIKHQWTIDYCNNEPSMKHQFTIASPILLCLRLPFTQWKAYAVYLLGRVMPFRCFVGVLFGQAGVRYTQFVVPKASVPLVRTFGCLLSVVLSGSYLPF